MPILPFTCLTDESESSAPECPGRKGVETVQKRLEPFCEISEAHGLVQSPL